MKAKAVEYLAEIACDNLDKEADGDYVYILSVLDEKGGYSTGDYHDPNCLTAIAMSVDMLCQENDLNLEDTLNAIKYIVEDKKATKQPIFRVIDCEDL